MDRHHPANLNNLPPELLCQICDHLNLSDLYSLMATSKRLSKIIFGDKGVAGKKKRLVVWSTLNGGRCQGDLLRRYYALANETDEEVTLPKRQIVNCEFNCFMPHVDLETLFDSFGRIFPNIDQLVVVQYTSEGIQNLLDVLTPMVALRTIKIIVHRSLSLGPYREESKLKFLHSCIPIFDKRICASHPNLASLRRWSIWSRTSNYFAWTNIQLREDGEREVDFVRVRQPPSSNNIVSYKFLHPHAPSETTYYNTI